MQKSDSIANLTKALVKAQAQMGSAVKGNKNPFFKSNYSDLPTVMEVVKEPLNENGLIVLQPGAYRDGKNFIVTTILHADSGEFISSETEVICAKQNDAQAYGAAQTYARRFGLQSMLFIPCTDDDGNIASGRTVPAQPKAATPAQPKAVTPVATLNGNATTSVIVTSSTPTGGPTVTQTTTVEPLKKSSFRKTPAAPAAAAPAAPTEEWS